MGAVIKASIFLLLIGCIVLGAAPTSTETPREIKIIPDETFGVGTDWSELFPYGVSSMVQAPDGSFFLTAIRQDKIFHFTEDGRLIKSIGQKGVGPGDMNSPSELSILDERCLVVQQDLRHRRIDLFDLKGNFQKTVRTTNCPYRCIALKNNKLGLLYQTVDPKETKYTFKVIIKEIESGEELTVTSFQRKYLRGTIQARHFQGSEFISRASGGELLVAFSDTSDISIYSLDGKKTHSFRVNLTRSKVTDELKSNYLDIVRKALMEKPGRKRFLKEISKTKFPALLPYYQSLYLDKCGNVYLFKMEDPTEISRSFYLFSKKGNYKGEFKLSEEVGYRVLFPLALKSDYAIFRCLIQNEDEDEWLIIRTKFL